MSLDKAIEHGKEKRKLYYNSKAFDTTCRNHGSCSWCEENRLHSRRAKEVDAKMKIKEAENDRRRKSRRICE